MDPLRIQAGELTVQEILDALEDGRRIVVRANLFGAEREMTLRHDGETFYCDTPTRLHKHEEASEMRTCIERMGYGKDDDADGGDDVDSGDDETDASDATAADTAE